MPGYDREQLDNIRRMKSTPAYKAASPRERKALFEAVIVESGIRDLNHGDRDSLGILQQRNNGAWGAAKESVELDSEQFLKAAKVANTQGGSAGSLAARVQRPAAQYAGRYHQQSSAADKLVGAEPTKRAPTTATAPTLTPRTETTNTKGAVVAALLSPKKKMSLIGRIQEQLSSGNFTKIDPATVTPGKTATAQAPAAARTGKGDVESKANAIDKKKLPYLWGGGHGGKVDAYKATPLDCSGAVSAILGINPRVAAQFKGWGKAGRDPEGELTIWANDGHVLAEINGKFWGTSKSNPGGGAGWIDRKNISSAYLSRFTARHA